MADLMRSEPGALLSKAGKAANAIDVLGARPEPEAWSVGEGIALSVEVAEDAVKKPRAKGARP